MGNIVSNFIPKNLANYNQKGKFFLRHKWGQEALKKKKKKKKTRIVLYLVNKLNSQFKMLLKRQHAYKGLLVHCIRHFTL